MDFGYDVEDEDESGGGINRITKKRRPNDDGDDGDDDDVGHIILSDSDEEAEEELYELPGSENRSTSNSSTNNSQSQEGETEEDPGISRPPTTTPLLVLPKLSKLSLDEAALAINVALNTPAALEGCNIKQLVDPFGLCPGKAPGESLLVLLGDDEMEEERELVGDRRGEGRGNSSPSYSCSSAIGDD